MLPGATGATSLWPGATTSGFAKPSYHVGPLELYGLTRSSERRFVPPRISAPTVSEPGAFPGDAIPPNPGRPVVLLTPKLPADDTTRMPAAVAFSAATTSGSVAAD